MTSARELATSTPTMSIRGVITGGHTGITRGMMDKLPALEVVAVNGVGTDAVDLDYARVRKLPVTGTFGALTEDVADLAIGLLLMTCRNLGSVDRFVRSGAWVRHPQPGAIPLARRFSGMRVGIVGMGRVGRAVPNVQPMNRRAPIPPPSNTPASAGTIRYENTSSTPATRTELATTTPNDA